MPCTSAEKAVLTDYTCFLKQIPLRTPLSCTPSQHPLKGSKSPEQVLSPSSHPRFLQVCDGAHIPGHNCSPPAARQKEGRAPQNCRAAGMRAGTLPGRGQPGAGGGMLSGGRPGPGAGLISVLRLPLEFTSNEQKVLDSAWLYPLSAAWAAHLPPARAEPSCLQQGGCRQGGQQEWLRGRDAAC